MRRWLAGWTLAFAAACAGGRGENAGRDSLAVAVNPGTPQGRIALELWQLRPGMRLLDWVAEHAEDDVIPARGPDGDRWGDWCAAAVLRADVAGRAVERVAHFYPPPPPNDLALPDSAPDLVRACVLGLVRAAAPVPDSATGAGLADSVRRELGRVFDSLERDPDLSFFGSAFWTVTGRARRGDVTAVSAHVAPRGASRAVLAFAWLPAAGLKGATDRYGWGAEDSVPVDTAARWSGLAASLWAPLRRALDSAGAPWPALGARASLPAADLAGALRRWLDASRRLPPPRRAAALYAADQILERTLCAYGLCEGPSDAALAPLVAQGAGFSWSELGGQWVYTHDWMGQARALDRDGPLGQRIFLHQLSRALDFSGTCEGGMDGFRRVIGNAERYLERLPASPIAADVHALAGDAWRDIVALAHGAGDIYADSSRYGAEAPEARRRAIAHYRAALAAGPEAPVARYAWRRAWWLLSGLPPRGVRFFCVYD